MQNLDYSFLYGAARMPALTHSNSGGEDGGFDICSSNAAAWLVALPEVRQKIFDMARRKGLIEYDADTHKWRGVDYGN